MWKKNGLTYWMVPKTMKIVTSIVYFPNSKVDTANPDAKFDVLTSIDAKFENV